MQKYLMSEITSKCKQMLIEKNDLVRFVIYKPNQNDIISIAAIGEFKLKDMFLKSGKFAAHARNWLGPYANQSKMSIETIQN